MTGTVTVDLEAAGLTHARGKSDRCAGRHDVDLASVTALHSPDWTPTDTLPPVIQALHEQAHPGGTLSWEHCREAACTDAWDALYGEES